MNILNLKEYGFKPLQLTGRLNDLEKLFSKKLTIQNVLIATGSLATSYAMYKIVKFWLRVRSYNHLPGPPYKGLMGILTGHIPEVNAQRKNGGIYPDLLLEWHEKYGEVFLFRMFHRIYVVTSDKNAIKEILVEKNFTKDITQADRVGTPMNERTLGYGLLTEIDNSKWKPHRAMFNPAFNRQVLKTFAGHFNHITDQLLEKFRTIANDKTPVTLLNELSRVTLDSISGIAFSLHTDAVNEPKSILNDYVTKSLSTTFKNYINPFFQYNPLNYKEVNEFKRMVRHIREIGRNNINEHLTALKNNDQMPNDILSIALKNYNGKDLDLDYFIDEFVTFFGAGLEATANALASCFFELARNPEIVRKAREEIDGILGERTEVTFADVNQFKYCAAIFQETLRLYPPSAFVFRISDKEMTINGYKIPKNTSFLIPMYVNHRSPKYFKDPLVFRPERFLKNDPNEEKSDLNYTYLPFSLGPRNCIGQNFANLEGVIVMVKLLQKLNFRLDPTQSMGLDQTLNLFPKDGARCFISLRE